MSLGDDESAMLGDAERPEVQAGLTGVDLGDTTALVTGSTSGIGRAAAVALGRLGATVLVHGRDEVAGEMVVEEVETAGGEAEFLRADFFELEAVEGLAEAVRESTGELDVLCNNAGGYFSQRGETSLGVSRAMHVNHFAHYHLTAELVDHLAPGARVVTTSSLAHRGATSPLAGDSAALGPDRALEVAGFGPTAAYCRSKLANIQFTRELAGRLQAADLDVVANAFHPGIVPGSGFGRAFPNLLSGSFELLEAAPFAETPEDGAATMVYLAAAPAVADTTGSYFARQHEIRPAGPARDEAAGRSLWERSAEILDIEEPLADRP
jgi:NAD(P)-dependent dehydrogenase (short-subunit alcohol dehydrogenase family)